MKIRDYIISWYRTSIMSPKTEQAQKLDKINRAERLLATIATLEEQIKHIRASGEVAPKDCHLARYQARGQYKAYWYYKLQAKQPIFTSKKGQNQPCIDSIFRGRPGFGLIVRLS